MLSLHSTFTWTGSSVVDHSLRQKTRDTGLPDGEDCIALRSVVLIQYQSVMDEYVVAYAVLATRRICVVGENSLLLTTVLYV